MPNEKEMQLLEFIRQFIDDNGYAPSYAEMMDGTGVTTKGTIHNRIESLVAQRRLARVRGIARSIRVLDCTPMVDSDH